MTPLCTFKTLDFCSAFFCESENLGKAFRENELLPGYRYSPIWCALGLFVAHGERHADLKIIDLDYKLNSYQILEEVLTRLARFLHF